MSCITLVARYPAPDRVRSTSFGTSSRAPNLSHSSLPAGFRWSHCENCVDRIELVKLVVVGR